MKIAIGCDHGGFEHKNAIAEHLKERGFEVADFGIYENKPIDYPEIAGKVANSVKSGENDLGILVCGTGIGISIAANKIPGIRAALCTDCFCAQATREHNDANILALGGRVVGPGLAIKIVQTFLETPFSNDERHKRRICLIESEE